jgi:hypothetical protein
VIPTHILSELRPGECVAILARRGELSFVVHAASDDAVGIQANADRDGSEVLATHLRDRQEILDFVAARERDVGGEG